MGDVQKVLAEHLSIADVKTRVSTHLFRDLELDSIQQLTFVVELENHFKICFDEGDEPASKRSATSSTRWKSGWTRRERAQDALAVSRACRRHRRRGAFRRTLGRGHVSQLRGHPRACARRRGRTARGRYRRGGDRVAVAIPTGIEFYDAFFGAVHAGAVPVSLPLPRRFGPVDDYLRATDGMLATSGARILLASERNRKLLSPAKTELGTRCAAELPRGTHARVEVSPDALGLVQFSSGTTDAPKAVALTHAHVIANVDAILGAFLSAYPEKDGFEHRGVSWLPLYHDMGLVGAFLTALVRPGPLALMSPELFVARPARWLQAISHHRASVSAAPHFAYAMCLDRIRDDELDGVDLSSWRLALDGAETVTPSTLERFYERYRRYGLREEALTPVYGLAEAGLAVTFSPPKSRFRVRTFDGRPIVSAGEALPGFDVEIANPSADGVGRVLVRGPSIMSGYLGNAAASESALVDGWLDTGDEGFVEGGELYITGRDRDKVVLRGGNYAPEVFEEALDGVAGVRTGSVVATSVVTDGGEELVILAEAKSPQPDAAKSISAVLSERTGFVPHRVVLLDPGALPRTSSGKLRREEAARRFLG